MRLFSCLHIGHVHLLIPLAALPLGTRPVLACTGREVGTGPQVDQVAGARGGAGGGREVEGVLAVGGGGL